MNLIARKNVETLSTPIAMWKQYLMFPLLKLLEKEGENLFHNMLPEEEACEDLGEEVVGGWD